MNQTRAQQIDEQRRRVTDAQVAYEFATHYTKEVLRERAQWPEGSPRADIAYQLNRALAEESRCLVLYRSELATLMHMQRDQRHLSGYA